ncbi:hypothetical protein VZH09_06180 [Synechococcus elongatus IITB7]|uniref:hypothetical protein n=1 Tax=Synechococcus elongatus TaxID=32046 RepID=UPI0030CFE163
MFNRRRYRWFGISLAVTAVVWIIRGLGWLGFLPSAILWLLLLVSAVLGLQALYAPRRWR